MTEWKVSTNYVAGQKVYEVYRLIDETELHHSGNRETRGLFGTKEAAQELADKLNEGLGEEE